MSKRKALDWAYKLSPLTMERLRIAWELGRIAGIKQAARRALIWHTDMEDNWRAIVLQRDSTVSDLRAHARKLKARLK